MKLKTDEFGQPLMVMRPTKKKKACKMATKCLRTQQFVSFEEMIKLCGPYTFVGYLTDKGEIVNESFKVVNKLQQGDSFVTNKIEKPKTDEKIGPDCFGGTDDPSEQL